MKKLLWNEGMSVGIEALDNDHKKIITIIDEISRATDNGSTEGILDDIFNELEQYVTSHFAREEAMMHAIGYQESTPHKKLHQQFIDKIPELKALLFRSESLDVIERINQFLHNWIIHHILVEDMGYVQTAYNHRQKNQQSNHAPPLKKISCWLNLHLKLSTRFFLSSIFPLIGMLLLSFIILNENYQQYKNMLLLSGLNAIVFQVNTLSDTLQTERGLSSGYISSDSTNYTQQLSQSRITTDKAIEGFFSEVSNSTVLLKDQKALTYIKQFKQELSELKTQRALIDQKQSSFEQLYSLYSRLVEHLLLIGRNLVHIDMNSQLANNIIAINAILTLKETIGQERALGIFMIEKDFSDPDLLQQLNALQGKKNNTLQVFSYSADTKQKIICHSLCEQLANTNFSSQLFIESLSGSELSLSSPQWFNIMSENISQLKSITDQLVSELYQKTQIKLNFFLNKFYLVMFIFTAVFLISGIISILLNHSIIHPIHKITQLLRALTSGNKTQHIYEQFSHDEIGEMFAAYEKLRLKLLQADIAQDVIYGQEKSLQFRKHENAHYKELASIDPLTGALNRRKFDEIIEEEILHASEQHTDLSLMLLDIDHFKRINDSYGHNAGDQALRHFYQICHKMVRFSDIITRIGGEEFIILMPQTNLLQAEKLAERIRTAINDTDIIVDDKNIHLTVSIGVTRWDEQYQKTSCDLTKQADKALYEAKNSGRNQVVVKTPEVA